jgi:hypothetical protein
VTFRNVTLTGGRESDDGGAIDMNGGNLTVIESTLIGNCSADSAGAIENEDGDTTIIRSTLSGNDADDQGGAVRSKRGNTLLVNSTVTDNTQAVLGAVDSGQPDDGVEASLTLVYSTIVANANDASVDCDVGIFAESDTDPDDDVGATQVNPANVNAVDTFASFGTVVALPAGGPNCDVVNPGSQGYNYADDDSCGFTDPTDAVNGDPLLGALADNGGPTQTRLPLAGSPLIDAIPVANCPDGDALASDTITTDQRNLPRPAPDGQGEIGAVELQPPPPPPDDIPPAPAPPAAIVLVPTFTG